MSAPSHDAIGAWTRAFEIVCLVAAGLLLAANVVRLASGGAPAPLGLVLALGAGALAADLVSGLVHWLADTWGSEDLPVLGRRFLRPFRVHHVNPDDFLRRNFVDTNGDVALLAAPVLGLALWLPLDGEPARIGAAFMVAFAGISLPTNQVHQWAHLRERPRVVDWLQRRGVILAPEAHALHHVAPHASRYCIATGWCNRPLDALGFFRALERAIQRATGVLPRREDAAFAARVESEGA